MDSQDAFEIETRHPAANVVLLAVRGEVDVCSSLALMEAMTEAFARHPEVLAVDLSGLKYIDSAGLGVLTHGGGHIEDGGTRFVVVLPSDHQLSHLPQLTGLHRRLDIHESVDEALRPWLDEAGELPLEV